MQGVVSIIFGKYLRHVFDLLRTIYLKKLIFVPRSENLRLPLLRVHGPEASLAGPPEDEARGQRVGLLQRVQNLSG